MLTTCWCQVQTVENFIMQEDCGGQKMPNLKDDSESVPSQVPSTDTGSTSFPIFYVVAGLCLSFFLSIVTFCSLM